MSDAPKVGLLVGHGIRPDGRFDPGAVGGGWTEQTSGDILVDAARRPLSRRGADVRHEAYQNDPNYAGSTRWLNRWPADIGVSFHRDWIRGVDAMFAFSCGPRSRDLARHIVRGFERQGFPVAWNWTYDRCGLYLLRETDMPTVLIEFGTVISRWADEKDELLSLGTLAGDLVADWLDLPSVPSPPKRRIDVKLIRIKDGTKTVWVVNGAARQAIPNAEAFHAMGYEWSDVQDVAADHPLAQLPIGAVVVLPTGTTLEAPDGA